MFNGTAALLILLAILYIHTHPENAEAQVQGSLYLLCGIWFIGYCLQFHQRTRIAGILVTITPLLFLLFSFFFHIERGGLFHF
ncbi:hypothetical protein JCM19046_552 [Bacillus sp. JCM 19046]|nr:hypothetical protein JCM19045_987 [Bacillus sp. JCM 19045]GAF16141.1 hypothetical protein JCM19046_552 [Bacillus sp. JCM 19046]